MSSRVTGMQKGSRSSVEYVDACLVCVGLGWWCLVMLRGAVGLVGAELSRCCAASLSPKRRAGC